MREVLFCFIRVDEIILRKFEERFVIIEEDRVLGN